MSIFLLSRKGLGKWLDDVFIEAKIVYLQYLWGIFDPPNPPRTYAANLQFRKSALLRFMPKKLVFRLKIVLFENNCRKDKKFFSLKTAIFLN